MLWPAVRSALAIFLAVLLAGSLIGVMEGAGHAIFPASQEVQDRIASFQHMTPAEVQAELAKPGVRRVLADQPLGVFLVVLVAWMIGTLLGSWTAGIIARCKPLVHGLVAGGILLAVTLANMTVIPHPPWMWLASVILIPPAAFLGGMLAGVRIDRKPSRPDKGSLLPQSPDTKNRMA
ncbi:MAG: hypothetical protein U0800_05625 [Isosphaeraceae bacterium]